MKDVRLLESGVSVVRPISQEEAAMHGVSGVMMRLTPSGELHGKIGRLLEEVR